MTEPQAEYGLEEAPSGISAMAKEKMKELRTMANEGYLPIRLLAQIGGLAMIVLSIMGFVASIIHLQFLDALVEVYTFLLGFVVIILETKAFPKRFEQGLNKYALFLRFVWGRGCLYFVSGSLQATQVRFFHGGYVGCVEVSRMSCANVPHMSHLSHHIFTTGPPCGHYCGLLHDSCRNHVHCCWQDDCQQAFGSPQVSDFGG